MSAVSPRVYNNCPVLSSTQFKVYSIREHRLSCPGAKNFIYSSILPIMFRFVFVICALSAAVLAAPQKDLSDSAAASKAEMEQYQNENAHYAFDSAVNDDINDNNLHRSETRDGTKVEGEYSYSDGYVRRTVHYVADENGYRIVKEDMEEIGDGPVFNPDGQADVSGSQIGQYSIKLDQSDNEKHYKEIKAQ